MSHSGPGPIILLRITWPPCSNLQNHYRLHLSCDCLTWLLPYTGTCWLKLCWFFAFTSSPASIRILIQCPWAFWYETIIFSFFSRAHLLLLLTLTPTKSKRKQATAAAKQRDGCEHVSGPKGLSTEDHFGCRYTCVFSFLIYKLAWRPSRVIIWQLLGSLCRMWSWSQPRS